MLLLIDNHDSFTHNLAHLLALAWKEPVVARVDKVDPGALPGHRPEALILSPGPGRPRQCRGLWEILAACAGQMPILGICLGHQAIGEWLGMKLVRAPRPVHGHAVPLRHSGLGLFAGCPPDLSVARYHSLVLSGCGAMPLPAVAGPGLLVDAVCQPGLLMSLRHEQMGLWGLQFHPESFLSDAGPLMIRNFRRHAASFRPIGAKAIPSGSSCGRGPNLPH
ncbi:MAG: aminodeoxychorismate/anthranilate synthase component II [bacterium]|nr:aminodeoxychorismate/anthranilate synthase component II [bacterium]